MLRPTQRGPLRGPGCSVDCRFGWLYRSTEADSPPLPAHLGQVMVALPALVVAKLALHETMRIATVTNTELADGSGSAQPCGGY